MYPIRPRQAAVAYANNRRGDAYERKDDQAFDEGGRPVQSVAQRDRINDGGGGTNDAALANQQVVSKLFSKEKAIDYLTSNGMKRNDAELIVERFGTIEQHLDLALGYLKENRGRKPEEIIVAGKTIFETILGWLPEKGYSDEWVLLQHLAWLDPKFTGEGVLLAIIGNDRDRLRSAIGNLERLAFITIAHRDEAIGVTISGELQEQIVKYVDNNPHVSKKSSQVLAELSSLLNKFMHAITDASDEKRELAKVYLSTAESMFEHSANRGIPLQENKELASLNAKIGDIFKKLFVDHKKALAYQERALVMYRALYPGDHPDVATSLNNVGVTYETLGDAEKGLAYQERALAMYQALYPGNHPDVAKSLNNVGVVYETLGDAEKGLAYQERALAMYQVLYEGNHHDVAWSLNNVGAAYQIFGDIKKGLAYQKRALAMKQALYEGNHPDVAWSLSSVGVAYGSLGYVKKGLAYQERALAMRQALYEGNHLDVARSLNSVGIAYETLGDIKKGLAYFERALAMYQVLYEGNHPDVASSLNNVGDAYEALGYVKKGLVYKERALVMYQALYAGNHPDVAMSLNNVGIVYQALGDIKRWLTYQERALAMYQALYEGNHPDVASSLNNVGLAYQALGDIKKGIVYQERSLAMRQALYEGNHPSVAKSLNNVGLAYQDLGDFGKYNLYRRCASSGNGFINKRGLVTENILSIKQKLQKKVLNNLQEMAANGDWSYKMIGIDWGVLGYLDEGYLKKQLGSFNNAQNLKIAMALCFEAVTIGIANSDGQNPKCAIEFARAYPELIGEIVNEHPEYLSLESIARACLGEAEYRLVVAPASLNAALEANDEFKGQGTLAYGGKGYYEYYNTALDKLLKLRLGAVEPQIKRLSSWYLGGDEFSLAELAYKVAREVSNEAGLILVPANLQGKHWFGLAFKKSGHVVEAIYMDSEQKSMVPRLKAGLEDGLAMNGYKSRFFTLRLEKQRYNNCGFEAIENFAYYLTGTRATQEGALWLHSLLVENSLLDLHEYGLKIEENNKLIGFLSNAAPLPIRSMDFHSMSSSDLIRVSFKALGDPSVKHENDNAALGALGPDEQDAIALNLLPAVKQFNILWAKWVQDKMQQVNAVVYKTTIGFKGLDLAVDSARLVYEPGLDNLKVVGLDAACLYVMAKGVNGYSAFVSGAEVVYQLHLGEYQKAFDVVVGSLSAMALPVILALGNRPYLGFCYGLLVAAGTSYNAVMKAYSFASEFVSGDATLRSAIAYKDLVEWLAASPLQGLHDFEADAKEYKLRINELLFEKEKLNAKSQLQEHGEFGKKVFDYIYLPVITEKYDLLKDVIIEKLAAEKAKILMAKSVAITYGALAYDHCVETKNSLGVEEGIKSYYCYSLEEEALDQVVVIGGNHLEVLERL